MAEQSVIVELKVSSEEAVNNIAEATKELDSLKAQKKALAKEDEDYYKKKAEYERQEMQYKEVIKANTDVLKQQYKQQKANEGSLVQLRAQLKEMTTAYDNLSEAERDNIDVGVKLQKDIQQITNKIKHQEEETGRFQRNVGNYTNSIATAFTNIGGAAGGAMANGITKASGALKIMSMNPIIGILGLLAGLISKIIEGFKKSEVATNNMSKAMSGFKVIGDAVSNILEGISSAIAWVVEKMGDLVAMLTGAEDALAEQKRLAEEEVAITQAERDLKRDIAKMDRDIAKYRYDAADKTKKLKERQEAAAKAEELLTKQGEKNLDLAKRKLKYAQDAAALAPNDKKANDELATAVENVYKAETSMWNRRKEVMTQQNKLAQGNKDLKKTYDELNAAIKAQEKERNLHWENEIRSMELAGASEEEILKAKFQMAVELEKQLMEYKGEADEEYISRTLDAQEAVVKAAMDLQNYLAEEDAKRTEAWLEQENRKLEEQARMDEAEKARLKARADLYNQLGNVMIATFSGLSSIMSQFADKSKSMAIADAGIKLAQCYISQAVAIANAVREASATPFPANIAAITTSVTAVLTAVSSTISTIKTAKNQISQFATGGYISGPGTGTSDSIPAMLSNGESVINAKSTKMFYPLLSAINQAGGGVAFGKRNGSGRYAVGGTVTTDALAGSFRTSQMEGMIDAISKMQPVVSVKEITKTQNRVQIKENISRS